MCAHATHRMMLMNAHSNECKRRKVKCNGQAPCQRCQKQSLECACFPERRNSKQNTECATSPSAKEHLAHMTDGNISRHVQQLSLQITSLQKQISTLSETLVVLNAETCRPPLNLDCLLYTSPSPRD